MKHLGPFPYFLLAIITLMTTVFPGVAARHNTFPESYSLENIDIRDGLPHNFIEDIYRDSDGFLWVATSTALSRYDGYEFITFTPNSIARNIKSAFPRKVAEDNFGRLWLASDGGIDIINLTDLTPTAPADPTGALQQISFTPSTYVCNDAEGNIWLRNTSDIICISFDDKGDISGIVSTPHLTTSFVTTGPVKPVEGEKGVMTAIGGFPSRLTLEQGKISVAHISDDLSVDPGVYIADFAKTGSRLWVATAIGLYSIDTADGTIQIYDNFPGIEERSPQNFVTSLTLTPQGDLLAGGLNGLNVYNRTDDTFSHIDLNKLAGEAKILNNNFVNCLLAEEDIIWVGTEGCGIDIFTPRRIFSQMLRHNPADPSSISPNCVNAIYEDGDGTIWTGTLEGGLNRGIDGYGKGFTHYTRETGTLSHNSVSAITSDHTGRLWVGTWGGGINVLDRANPTRRLMLIDSAPDGAPLHHIGTLAYDPYNNAIWIGVNSGIYIYDIAEGRLSAPFELHDRFRGGVASAVAPDGTLWIGTMDGLLAVNLKRPAGESNFKFTHFPHKLDNPSNPGIERISAISIGHDATVWIGTNGNGLYRLDTSGGKLRFINYSTDDGLPNDVIHGIAEDPHGNLWAATYNGLACMTPDGRFINFSRRDGLETEQFYWNAYCPLSNGDILFGSVDGMLAVKGLLPSDSREVRHVRFTSLKIDNNPLYGNISQCRIPESERSFEIGFSAFDYARRNSGRYLYRMEGYDNTWQELPSGRHSAAYMNLTPGQYNLEVKYVAEGMDPASAPVSSFNVEIIPNFYRRWWFIALMVILLTGIVAGIYLWRIADLKRQRNELKMAVEDSVREISEQKAQVQQLTADRIAFFTNITHEFRTPITLIIGPIERALRLSKNPKVIEQLNFVERNSRYLLSLVNQLMDFRKIESGKMERVTERGDITRFVEELANPFRALAEERHIRIRTLFHLPTPIISFNEDALRKVLTNLLGNALKFTPDNGCVTIYTAICGHTATHPSTESEGKPGNLYLCVSDTGCGLQEDETEKIFGHFYQGHSHIKYPLIGANDSGIGLYLCRRLVEVYGGSITARNNHGAGCSFRVMIPVEFHPTGLPAVSPTGLTTVKEPREEESADSDIKPTILIVEDNEDMRAFMRSVLSDRYHVKEAPDGEKALAILLKDGEGIDFIISDLMMPGMDGLELASKVKENFAISHIPFIMLTAKTSQESRMEGYRRGVDDYILKPFDEEMLLTRIQNILDNRRRYQRRFGADMKTEHLEIKEESRDKKFVDKVMEVIKANYTNSYYELPEMAEALGVSRSLLNRKLNSLLGQTAIQLLRSYRLTVAHELITSARGSHETTVAEVAFKVGFNDSKYFTRCFTKHFGTSPSSLLRGVAAGEEREQPGEEKEGD